MKESTLLTVLQKSYLATCGARSAYAEAEALARLWLFEFMAF
jgi:hypothetical protein